MAEVCDDSVCPLPPLSVSNTYWLVGIFLTITLFCCFWLTNSVSLSTSFSLSHSPRRGLAGFNKFESILWRGKKPRTRAGSMSHQSPSTASEIVFPIMKSNSQRHHSSSLDGTFGPKKNRTEWTNERTDEKTNSLFEFYDAGVWLMAVFYSLVNYFYFDVLLFCGVLPLPVPRPKKTYSRGWRFPPSINRTICRLTQILRFSGSPHPPHSIFCKLGTVLLSVCIELGLALCCGILVAVYPSILPEFKLTTTFTNTSSIHCLLTHTHPFSNIRIGDPIPPSIQPSIHTRPHSHILCWHTLNFLMVLLAN